MKEKNIRLEEFIDFQIEKIKKKINILLKKPSHANILEKLLKAEIFDVIINDEEEEFLQKNNILFRNAKYKLGWNDKIVEKAFEKLKKDKRNKI